MALVVRPEAATKVHIPPTRIAAAHGRTTKPTHCGLVIAQCQFDRVTVSEVAAQVVTTATVAHRDGLLNAEIAVTVDAADAEAGILVVCLTTADAEIVVTLAAADYFRDTRILAVTVAGGAKLPRAAATVAHSIAERAVEQESCPACSIITPVTDAMIAAPVHGTASICSPA